MRLGLIVNRLSRRNRRRNGRVLIGDRNIVVEELDDIRELPAALKRLADEGIEILATSGGDGTVQATLTALMNGGAFEETPPLAILAGGTTNMISGDVGISGTMERALGRLAKRLGDFVPDRDTVTRHVIRVDYLPGGQPLYGMFFGTAAICRAILLCRGSAEPVGITAGPASAVTLATILLRRLTGRGDAGGVIDGDDMVVRFDEGPPMSGPRMLALVTTLDRVLLRAHPFWGSGPGALRYSAVAHPAPRLARSVYPFLYGRGDRLPAAGYESRNAQRISFEMRCTFTLDGELYEPVPGRPVELADGGPVRFVKA